MKRRTKHLAMAISVALGTTALGIQAQVVVDGGLVIKDVETAQIMDMHLCADSTGATGATGEVGRCPPIAGGTGATGPSIIGGATKDIKKNEDRYFGLFGSPNANSSDTESDVQGIVPKTGSVTDFYVLLSDTNDAASSSYTFTLRKDGSDTSVTCQVTTTDSCNDTTHCADFTAGQKISVSSHPSDTDPTDNLDLVWTALFHQTPCP